MKAYRDILVPLDGSAASRRATREAIALARRLKARIKGLHVVALDHVKSHRGTRPPGFLAAIDSRARRKAERIGCRLETACRAARLRCHCYTIWNPFVADAIVQFAKEQRCDLIVMGSHGESVTMRRILKGSIARTVMRRSRVPVVVCR